MRRILGIVVLVILYASSALAQSFSLQMIRPAAIGAAGTGLDDDDTWYWAAPGVPYVRQAGVRGLGWPLTFSLVNAPSGMTVKNAGLNETCGRPENGITHVRCGEVTWPNPTADATNIQLCATNTLSVQVCKTWSITVTTSGWIYADASGGSPAPVNGGSGTGAIGTPYQTLEDLYDASGANSRCVFRGSNNPASPRTYTINANLRAVAANQNDVNGEERIVWNQIARCVTWMVYPGEYAKVDVQYNGLGCGSLTSPTYGCGDSRPRIRLEGAAVTLLGSISTGGGFTMANCMTQCFHFADRSSQHGVTVVGMSFDTFGPGLDGGNSAALMWASTLEVPSYWDFVAETSFENGIGGSSNCHMKVYGVKEALFDNNTYGSMSGQTGDDEAVLALKGDRLEQVIVRANWFKNTHNSGIGGNNTSVTNPMTAEYSYNLIESAGNSISGEGPVTIGSRLTVPALGRIDVFRNTIRGVVVLDNIDAGEGPVNFTQNVIVNGGGTPGSAGCAARLSCASGVTSTSPITLTNMLQGANDGTIIDSNGYLTSTFRASDGPGTATPKGFEQYGVSSLIRMKRMKFITH